MRSQTSPPGPLPPHPAGGTCTVRTGLLPQDIREPGSRQTPGRVVPGFITCPGCPRARDVSPQPELGAAHPGPALGAATAALAATGGGRAGGPLSPHLTPWLLFHPHLLASMEKSFWGKFSTRLQSWRKRAAEWHPQRAAAPRAGLAAGGGCSCSGKSKCSALSFWDPEEPMCREGNCFVLSPRWCQVSNEVLLHLPPSRAGSGSRKRCWGPGGAAELPVTWGKSAAFCFF